MHGPQPATKDDLNLLLKRVDTQSKKIDCVLKILVKQELRAIKAMRQTGTKQGENQ